MKVIVTDTGIYPGTITAEDVVIRAEEKISPCQGCFSCWTKTPGACILEDDLPAMGELLARCDELVIVSRCLYGSYSPFVASVLQRSICYVHPDFVFRDGLMRHKERYDHELRISAYFYGAAGEQDKKTAEQLVRANARNLNSKTGSVMFFHDAYEIGGLL
jgi:multimeric flavodoxin WrbA